LFGRINGSFLRENKTQSLGEIKQKYIHALYDGDGKNAYKFSKLRFNDTQKIKLFIVPTPFQKQRVVGNDMSDHKKA
jgi:hypothetical protein